MVEMNENVKKNLQKIEEWSKDVFLFCEEVLGMQASEPIDELRGKPIKYKDAFGEERTTILFDPEGRLVYHDLSFYKMEMFKNQTSSSFLHKYRGKRFTWQQTVELEAYQRGIETFGKDSFDVAKRWITIRSGHGLGKCLGYGTKIIMADGSIKEVQNIKVGDEIMGDDSTPRKVISTTRGKEQMYRIRYKNGSYYDVNESHILSLVATQTHGRQKTGDITNVSVKEYLTWSDRKKRTNVGYKRPVKLPEKKLPIDPYLLGLWLGDGCSVDGRIFNVDNEIKNYLKSVGIGKESINPRNNCWNATVLCLKPKLRDIGVLGNKHIPLIYKQSSIEQRLELLAGLIDTDGCKINNAQYEITQKNKQLAEDILYVVQSCGLHGSIHKTIKKSQNGTSGEYWRVTITRNAGNIPVRVERKKIVYGNRQRENLHFSFDVIPLGLGDYYGFEIDGNKLFMLGDCTVTHNTSYLSIVSLHFLICFFGAQIGVTANTEDQLKDIFLKELSKWAQKLPEQLRNNLEFLDDFVRVSGEKDWFLRARVARPEKPEALAGLHGEYVLIIVDEASAVHDRVFETMKGALTGENYLVIYASNPTRNEGEFYESHKKGSNYTKLHFSSRHSPIVKEGYIEKMEADYGADSDEVRIRVDGEFAGETEMDDKGWIPLFANMVVHFEPERGQIINRAIIGVDPAGQGRDRSIVHIRDNVYLKEVLNEKTSTEIDLARKIETIRDAYNCSNSDIGIEAFGIGARVVANVRTKTGENVTAVLTDKPREEVKDKFHTYKSELAWRFREWVARGGIIITNNPKAWMNELEKIKYKRDNQGRIMLMNKVEFKKEYRFSPDRFDAACMTFFKEEPTTPIHLTKENLEAKEMQEWLHRIQSQSDFTNVDNYSGM